MPAPSASKEKTSSPVQRLGTSISELVDHPTSKAAHFYRTSLRRFQAWSAVTKPQLGSKQQRVLKLLEKLRKATGKLRDSEVHLELLDKVEGAGEKERKKVERALKAQRKSAKQKLSTLFADADLKKTMRDLRLIGEPPLAKASGGDHPLTSADQLALDEYRAFVQNRAALSPENLHVYRLACKGFRYTAELAGETPHIQSLLETWKKVQDVSGDWHDYLVLSELTEEICGDCTLHSLLVGLRDQKYDEAVIAINEAERKLLAESAIPKKEPRSSFSDRRRRAG